MPRRRSRKLIIDADVARASGGETATHNTAKACRDFLISVLDVCHQSVFTHALAAEWNTHQSTFARRWRAEMIGRKKVVWCNPGRLTALQARVERTTAREVEKRAIAKDFHLIEAAIETDKRVISKDDAVRSLLANASQTVGEIGTIVWVNPACLRESATEWLVSGAKSEKRRQLRYRRT